MTQFSYHIDANATRIAFPSKPTDAIRAMLKGAGFRWSPATGCWWRRGCTGAAGFLLALDRKLNPDQSDGACWRCQSPKGFFRPQGPATPVYCDDCFATLSENSKAGAPEPRIDRSDLDYEDACRDACGL